MTLHAMATDLLAFGLWVLALARATRLFTKDEITDPLRIAVVKVFGANSKMQYLSECSWCVGMWLALATAWSVFMLTDLTWWLYPMVAFAGSYLVGLASENLEEAADYDVIVED